MNESKKEFMFYPTDTLRYAVSGNMEEAQSITLVAPTSKHMVECAQLKQAFFRALPKQSPTSDSAETKNDADTKLTGEAIMGLIAMSPDVELSVVLLTAKELFSKNIGLIDGEVKLTKPLIDEMSLDDLESMTGEYLANFILASALTKMKNN